MQDKRKKPTVLQKGVTRQADYKEMGQAVLFHDILHSATALSSHQLRHPRDAGTWFLKGACTHCSGTVISHSTGGSLHPHIIKKTTHQSSSFPSEQMTRLFCFFFFFLFWTEICSIAETNHTSRSWEAVFPRTNTVLYKWSLIWRVTKHCSFLCSDRDTTFYVKKALYVSEGFVMGPTLAAEEQSGTTPSRPSRKQVFLITIHSNV